MSNQIKSILILIFLLFPVSVFGFVEKSESLILIQNDSTTVSTIDTSDKGIDFVLIAGLGIAPGSIWDSWGYYFSTGYVIALGLELPFSKSYDFAFQLYYNYWISKSRLGRNPNQYYWKYIQLSNDLFSGYGLSGIFKYYINIWTNKFRISFHLGYLFLSENPDHAGIDFGSGLYYSINENWIINLSSNFNFGQPFNGNFGTDVPNLLMLNIYYKF